MSPAPDRKSASPALPPTTRRAVERLLSQSDPSARLRRSLLMLAMVIAFGTFGYMVIEGWNVWDSLYMTVISVTTVGYKEVQPMSRMGELFTMTVLTVGVATVLYTFSFVMARVVEGDLEHRWTSRRRQRMINELTQHFIICGFGRIGRIIADEFARQRLPFVVIEREPERVQEALTAGYLAVEADASSEHVLTRVGIQQARALIAAVGSDAENVYAVLSARLMRPDLFIIARAETEDAKTKLTRAGADRVVAPYQIGGVQLAQTALRPAVVDFVQIATSSESLELSMEQVTIGQSSELVDKSLLDAALRQRFGVVVVGIKRADGRMDFNPEPDTTIHSGDQLVVLGRPENLLDLTPVADGPPVR